jgi:hypothetical protein
VFNIGVQRGFKILTVVPNADSESAEGGEADDLPAEPFCQAENAMRWADNDDPKADSLRTDVIGRLRKLVVAIRASPLRRFSWIQCIIQGLEGGTFGADIRNLQLLRDMVVCWSSTFVMIDRALLMRPVSAMCSCFSFSFCSSHNRSLPST